MTTETKSMTTAEAIALFDSLEPATADEMLGRWRGEGIDTGHPLDGMLEATYWHGKLFEGPEAVVPLRHRVPLWGEIWINPARLPVEPLMGLSFLRWVTPWLMPLMVLFVRTGKPKARLRTLAFRGRHHAAMVYDDKPINDVFARMDEGVVMGWMDHKGMDQPYFFKLTRED